MNTAISMSLEGRQLYASDPRLKAAGYWQFGLRCSVCGEAVYWRSKWANSSHFAHFPKNSPAQNCSLRVDSSSDSHSFEDSYAVNSNPLRLADIQEELIYMLLDEQVNIEKDVEIHPDEIEQNVINLMQWGNAQKNIGIFERVFWNHYVMKLECAMQRIVVSIGFSKDEISRDANFHIGQEILCFVSRPANSLILYNLVHFHRLNGVENEKDAVKRLRIKVIQNIVIKDWKSLIEGETVKSL